MGDFLHPYKSKCVRKRALVCAARLGLALLAPLAAFGQIIGSPTSLNAVKTERALTTVAGLGPHNASGPYEGFPGLAVPLGGLMGSIASADGRYLYFSDATANQVKRLDLVSGTVITIVGTGDADKYGDGGQAKLAALNYPRGLALDSTGNLYIADYNNHTVRRVDTSGIITTATGVPGSPGYNNGPQGRALLNAPVSLLVTSSGTLLIGEEQNFDVRSYDLTSHITSPHIGSSTPGWPSGFKPFGLAAGPSGLFVSDYANSRVFSFDGTTLTAYAGNGSKGYAGDGGAKESATFTYLEGLVYDSVHGTLSMADMGNGRVRQVAVTSAAEFPVGTVRTVAGATGGYMITPALKVPATKPAAGMGGLPSEIYGLTLIGEDMYIVGGVAPSVFSLSAGYGSVVRLSREDGYVIPRFYAQFYSGYLSFELPAHTTWSTVELGGSPGLKLITIQDCDLGSSYATAKLCRPVVQVDSTAGPANGYIRIGTLSADNVPTYRDFGIVAESGKSAGIIVPQASTSQDLTSSATAGGATVSQPSSASLNLAGKPVISDSGSNQVYLLNNNTLTLLAGSTSGSAGYSGDNGSPTSAQLNGPTAVVHAPSDLYYIADAGNHVIRMVDPLANTIRTVAGNGTSGPPTSGTIGTFSNLGTPSALAMRRDGTLLIADSMNNMVLRLDPRTGILDVIAGTGAAARAGDGDRATSASLNNPSGLAVGPGDEIYIAERDGHDIRMIDPKTGFISTYAGSASGQAGNSGDFGAPLSALFNAPQGLSVDPSGGLVVADSGNQRTRYVTKPTSAGTQAAKVLPYLADGQPGLRSASSGLSLNGTMLRFPTGGGSLTFTNPGTQLLTVVDTGAKQPDNYVSYATSALTTGSEAFSLSSSVSGTNYPYCTAVNSGSGLLTGEACQWAVIFQPPDAKSYAGSGTLGVPYGNSLQLPFVLNGGTTAPLAFSGNHLPDAGLGASYTATAGSLSGGAVPYGTPKVTAGSLPAGLSLSLAGSDVIVSGKPTESGDFQFTVTVMDAGGTSASQPFTLSVKKAINIDVVETVHVTDTVASKLSLTVSVVEAVHVADSIMTTPARMVSFAESIHVTDAVSASKPVLIAVAETIHIVDGTSGGTGALTSTNEVIHVTDTVDVKVTGNSSQTINAAQIPNQVYGNQVVNLSATASSGLPVTAVLISGPAKLNGKALTFTGAGTVQLTFTQAGNSTYSTAPAVNVSFVVGKATATITANSYSRKFETANSYGFSPSGLVQSSDLAEWTGGPILSTTATLNSPAGAYPIHVGLGTLTSKNYNFQFVDGTLTVEGGVAQKIVFLPLPTFHLSVGSVTLTAHSTSGLKVGYRVLGPATVMGNKLHFTGVGSVSVTALQNGDATFNAATGVQRTFLVVP